MLAIGGDNVLYRDNSTAERAIPSWYSMSDSAICTKSKSITDVVGVLYEQVTSIKGRPWPVFAFGVVLDGALHWVYKHDANSLRDL